jgi:hypothetical protein
MKIVNVLSEIIDQYCAKTIIKNVLKIKKRLYCKLQLGNIEKEINYTIVHLFMPI